MSRQVAIIALIVALLGLALAVPVSATSPQPPGPTLVPPGGAVRTVDAPSSVWLPVQPDGGCETGGGGGCPVRG